MHVSSKLIKHASILIECTVLPPHKGYPESEERHVLDSETNHCTLSGFRRGVFELGSLTLHRPRWGWGKFGQRRRAKWYWSGTVSLVGMIPFIFLRDSAYSSCLLRFDIFALQPSSFSILFLVHTSVLCIFHQGKKSSSQKNRSWLFPQFISTKHINMHFSSFFFVASGAIFSLGSAQSIDPNSVPLSLRSAVSELLSSQNQTKPSPVVYISNCLLSSHLHARNERISSNSRQWLWRCYIVI